MGKIKIIRATTVPMSLNAFCNGMLYELSEHYEVTALSSPGPELDEVREREKVRTIAIPMQRKISLFKDLLSLIQMIHVFRKEKPDIVHSMTPKAGLLCMIAGWITRVPIRIHTFTGLVFPTSQGIKKRILMLTDKITCACATHIIPEGEGVKHDLIENNITKKPLNVLGYGNVKGVDLTRFSPNHVSHKGFIFLYVGRIAKDKGIAELIQACQTLPKDAQLWIVGSIDKSDMLTDDIIQQMELHPQIRLFGSTKDVISFYNQVDCLILPSYREGFPNVVLEAGAMELPCIVTDINGSREIISNNVNGLVIPPQDANSLHEAMVYLATHPEQAKEMGKAARPIIEQKFEQSFVRKCLYDYYKQIISSQ